MNLQSSQSCKLNTIAWVVELTYLHIIDKCESLLGGHDKARCTVIFIITARIIASLDVTFMSSIMKRNSKTLLYI